MAHQHCYVDLDKMPDDLKVGITDVAIKHNALCDTVGILRGDFYGVVGRTEREQLELVQAISFGRKAVRWANSNSWKLAIGAVLFNQLLDAMAKMGWVPGWLATLIKTLHFGG
jgi:hypothetical protein